MLNAVRQFVPPTWNANTDQSDVTSYSEEFQQISFEIRRAFSGLTTPSIRRLIRVQDLHSFGQFLIREQLLLTCSSDQLYKVRRYITVNRLYLDQVMKFNLDPRRCGIGGQTLTLRKTLSSCTSSNIIVVVKVLTTQPNADVINPPTSSDYYVEYIAEVNS